MLPSDILKDMGGSIKDVHDNIMYLENQLLKETNPGYPIHVVKVPTNVGFVDGYPGDFSLLDSKTSSGSCTCSGWIKAWSA
jgi:hypothetical protein